MVIIAKDHVHSRCHLFVFDVSNTCRACLSVLNPLIRPHLRKTIPAGVLLLFDSLSFSIHSLFVLLEVYGRYLHNSGSGQVNRPRVHSSVDEQFALVTIVTPLQPHLLRLDTRARRPTPVPKAKCFRCTETVISTAVALYLHDTTASCLHARPSLWSSNEACHHLVK